MMTTAQRIAPDRIIGILVRRFLFVLEYFPPHVGGVEVLFGELAAELVRRGHEVEVITSADSASPRDESSGGLSIRRIATPAFARRYLFMLLALPAAIRAARRADLIHTTTYNAAIPAWIAAKLARKPIVLTAHEVFGRQWNEMPGMNRLAGYAYRIFESLVLRLGYAHVITPSEFTRRRLPEPSQATAVHNAVDIAFWDASRHTARALPGPFTYLYFGRPGVSKGVEYLVEAAHVVRRQLPDSKLVMILSREPAAQYRRIVKSLQPLGDHVVLMESQPREVLASYLLGADVVVVPSISEGFGYSAMEASLLGCRVIATSGHATEELLTGVATFVPPKDAQALARAILSCGAAGFSPPNGPGGLKPAAPRDYAEKVIEIYERVVAKSA